MANICKISPIFVLLIVILCLKSSTSFPFSGTEVIIRNLHDKGVVTVGDGGEVYGDHYREGDPRQIWIIEDTPDRPVWEGKYRITNSVSEFNDLSGPNNPEYFPKYWGVQTSGPGWEIAQNGRWCIQSPGFGRRYTVDDCEVDFFAPYQIWEFEPVASRRHRF